MYKPLSLYNYFWVFKVYRLFCGFLIILKPQLEIL